MSDLSLFLVPKYRAEVEHIVALHVYPGFDCVDVEVPFSIVIRTTATG